MSVKPILPAILLLILAGAPRWASGDITSNLKAYWTFDQAGEQTVLNLTHLDGYDAVLGLDTEVGPDDPTWIDHGLLGSALSFDGADDYVSVPYIFDLGSSNVTFAAMVKQTEATGYQYFMSNKDDFDSNFIRLGFDTDNGKLRIYTEQDGGSNKTYVSDRSYTGSWRHVVVTRGGATGVLYVDGRHVAGFDAAGGDIGTTSDWFLGQAGDGKEFFHGCLDEVRVYNRELSAQDVEELFGALGLLPGDANEDGTIDLQDFGLLKANFGGPGGWSEGDFNGDDTIDLQDFGLLKSNFGAGVTPIPEPVTMVILAAAAAPLLTRRKR